MPDNIQMQLQIFNVLQKTVIVKTMLIESTRSQTHPHTRTQVNEMSYLQGFLLIKNATLNQQL